MIELYFDGEDTSKNGEILNPIDGKLTVVLGGENEIETTFFIDESNNIQNDKLLKVDTPTGKELYRIYEKNKSKNGIKVYARHKYFDLRHKAIIGNIKGTRQEILNYILKNTGYIGRYIGEKKDIITIEGKTNALEILNSLEDEYIVKGNIITVGKIGECKGYTVEFGYNLESIEEDINTDNIITRIYPCYKGIIGEAIDSKYINNYPIVNEKIIDFEITSEKDDEEYTEQQIKDILKVKGKEYFISTECDKPTCNYGVKMQELSKTTSHKHYKILENIGLGDTVECKYKPLKINCNERCISYEWDIIELSYLNIELGQPTETYNNRILKKEANTIKLIEDAVEKAEKDTNKLKVVMEKRDSEIELSVANEAEKRKSELKVLDDKIEQKVDSEEFTSYKSQTDREIKQSVKKKDFGSELTQHFDEIVATINDGTDHKAIFNSSGLTIKNGGFKIKNRNGDTIFWVDTNGVLRARYLWADDLRLDESSSKTASSLWNVLYNMESVSFDGKVKIRNQLICPSDNFYIDGFYSLEDFVEHVIYQYSKRKGWE